MGAERRQHRRYAVNWRARILLSDKSIHKVVIRDISAGGVAIEFDRVLPMGDIIGVEFYANTAKGHARMRMRATVCHHTLLANGMAFLGLEYYELQREVAHDLSNVLQLLQDSSSG